MNAVDPKHSSGTRSPAHGHAMRSISPIVCLAFLALVPALAPGLAHASTPGVDVSPAQPQPALMVLGPHLGFSLPQPFNSMASAPVYGLELGIVLPWSPGHRDRPLQLGVDVTYSAPTTEGEGFSSALGLEGASYSWQLTQHTLAIEPHLLWRFRPIDSPWNAYLSASGRMNLVENVMQANSEAQDFQENRERGTQLGFGAGTGLEWRLGPGAAFGALRMIWIPVDQRMTGETNASSLIGQLGYRFLL